MSFKTKYSELKKTENFCMILLKLVLSDKIINGYWMKFMAINAVTDLKCSLFCFEKLKFGNMKSGNDEKIKFGNSLTSL